MIQANCLFRMTVGKYQKEFVIPMATPWAFLRSIFFFTDLSNEYIASAVKKDK